MATCVNKIVKNIVSTCETQPIGGIEQVVYLINRTDIASKDFDTTNPSKVTDLELVADAYAYKLTGVKKALNAGSERVVSENQADGFLHKLSFIGFEFDSASVENMDRMSDLVAVVERKDKSNVDGTFVIYGLNTGLYVSADSKMENDENGVRAIELSTMDGSNEIFSQNNLVITDYAGTKAALEAMLEPVGTPGV